MSGAPHITDVQRAFIEAQDLFFVATAPTATDERVNVSPKGYGGLTVFDETTVGYLDLTGSGNETAAHLLDNGRMTIMVFAIDGDPLIVRLYGNGRVIRPGSEEWDRFFAHFEPTPGQRQIIVMDVEEVREACGFMVPVYEKVRDRTDLTDWAQEMGEDAMQGYRETENVTSIDGLPTGVAEPDAMFGRGRA